MVLQKSYHCDGRPGDEVQYHQMSHRGGSSIYGFPCIRIYFIKGGGYHCTGVRVADEPCRPAVQAERKTERKKPPEAKVGLESS